MLLFFTVASTVTADVENAVKNAKAGQVRYRTDKAGIIHCAIGRADFEITALKENLNTLLIDLRKAKPASAKGSYFKKLTISSTMGPGVSVDRSTVEAWILVCKRKIWRCIFMSSDWTQGCVFRQRP